MSDSVLASDSKPHILLAWVVIALTSAVGVVILANSQAAQKPVATGATTAATKSTATQALRLVWTSSAAYKTGQPVGFSFINRTSRTVSLANSNPWKIYDAKGQIVFTPTAVQTITQLAPSESRTWSWDQKDSQGKPVAAGKYRVVFDHYGSAVFTIAN